MKPKKRVGSEPCAFCNSSLPLRALFPIHGKYWAVCVRCGCERVRVSHLGRPKGYRLSVKDRKWFQSYARTQVPSLFD